MARFLSLRLLGQFEIEEPAGLRLPTRKAEALVAFLALSTGRRHHRGRLATLLWGSRDEAHARHNLNQALSSLRRQLGQDLKVIVAEGDRVALGQAFAAAGDPASALPPLDRAIELDPHDPHLWTFFHDRAEACFALGRLAEAEQLSRVAVSLPNATHFAHATLVAILGMSRNRAGAADAMMRLKRMKPDYALAAAAEELGHHANRPFVDDYLAGLLQAGLAKR